MDLDNLDGAVGHSDDKVSEKDTSVLWGTGALPIYSFSLTLNLIEKACCNAIQNFLPLGTTTIALSIDVKQLSGTPVGHHVQAEAKVIGIQGQKIKFKVKAFDEKGKIAEGFHERFAISADNFMEKISKKNIT